VGARFRRGAGGVAVLVALAATSAIGRTGAVAETKSAQTNTEMDAVTQLGSGYLAIGSAYADDGSQTPLVWRIDKRAKVARPQKSIPSRAAKVAHPSALTVAADDSVIVVGGISDEGGPGIQKPGAPNYTPGIWRSTNKGVSFKAVSDGTDWSTEKIDDDEFTDPFSDIEAVSIAASDDGVVIAVGTAGASPEQCGCSGRPVVWTSTDNGSSWKADYLSMENPDVCNCSGPENFRGRASAVAWSQDLGFIAVGTQWQVDASDPSNQPSDPTMVMWSSADNGQTWSESTIEDGYRATGIAISPIGIGVAANSDTDESCDGTMWFSDDAGDSWTSTEPDQDLRLRDVGLEANGSLTTVGETCDDFGKTSARSYSTTDGSTWQPFNFSKPSLEKNATMSGIAPYSDRGGLIVGQRNNQWQIWLADE
jgi:hypothetical protein